MMFLIVMSNNRLMHKTCLDTHKTMLLPNENHKFDRIAVHHKRKDVSLGILISVTFLKTDFVMRCTWNCWIGHKIWLFSNRLSLSQFWIAVYERIANLKSASLLKVHGIVAKNIVVTIELLQILSLLGEYQRMGLGI